MDSLHGQFNINIGGMAMVEQMLSSAANQEIFCSNQIHSMRCVA